ncbi:hypothetical protein Tco_1191376 [Tanacetum coccineum]
MGSRWYVVDVYVVVDAGICGCGGWEYDGVVGGDDCGFVDYGRRKSVNLFCRQSGIGSRFVDRIDILVSGTTCGWLKVGLELGVSSCYPRLLISSSSS